MIRFDDDWFNAYRRQLLHPPCDVHSPFREVEFARKGAAARVSEKLVETTDLAIGRLAPLHQAATRAHMQFYRACLECIRVVPPDAVMRSAVQIEWLWYSTPFKGFYRDHLAHVQKVTAVADYLLRSVQSPLAEDASNVPPIDSIATGLAAGRLGDPYLRHAARRLGNEHEVGDPSFWKNALLTTLRIAGLLHDMAYPSVMLHKVRKAATPNAPYPPQSILHDPRFPDLVDLLMSSLAGQPFRDAPYDGENGVPHHVVQLLNESHAAQGALRILKYTVENERVWRLTSFEMFCVEWATLATMMHDFDKQYGRWQEMRDPSTPKDKRTPADAVDRWLKKMSKSSLKAIRPDFKRDPAVYLLALSDQLQDFGRLNYRLDGEQTNRTAIEVRVPFGSVYVRRVGADAEIGFELNNGAHAVQADDPFNPAKVAERKREDTEKVFEGNDSWLRHQGIWNNVTAHVS